MHVSESATLELPDLRENNTHLVLLSVTCIGAVGLAARTYFFASESRLPLPPSPPNRRLLGRPFPASSNQVYLLLY